MFYSHCPEMRGGILKRRENSIYGPDSRKFKNIKSQGIIIFERSLIFINYLNCGAKIL